MRATQTIVVICATMAMVGFYLWSRNPWSIPALMGACSLIGEGMLALLAKMDEIKQTLLEIEMRAR